MFIIKSIDQYFGSLSDLDKFYILNNYLNELPALAVILYLLFVFLTPKILTKGLYMKPIMIVWNFFLSIFSFFIFIGITVPYIQIIMRDGFLETFVDVNNTLYTPSSMLFWSSLMILSKYAELFDTVWIVLKSPQKPVEFLHWFHHFTVVFYSWYGWKLRYTPGFIFMSINAAIHTVMYLYYGLKELGYNPNWNFILTQIQTLQMFVGVMITLGWTIIYYTQYLPCKSNMIMMSMSLFIYGSYLYLFAQFYFKKYNKPKNQ